MGEITKLKGTPRIPANQVRSINAIHQDEHCDIADAKRTTLVSPDGILKVDVVTDAQGKHRLAVDANIGDISFGDLIVDVAQPDTCDIQNHVVVTANAEFSLNLPDKTKRFNVTIRDCNGTMNIACGTGETGTKFKKIPMGAEYSSGNVDLPDNSKVFLRVSKAGAVVELESWYVA